MLKKPLEAGSGHDAQGQPHEKASEIPGVGFDRLGRRSGKAQLPQSEKTRGEQDENSRHDG